MQNYSSKFKIFLLIILLSTFSFSLLTFSWSEATAQTMSNTNYRLQMGNLNMTAGKPTGPSNKLNLTVGQTAPGLYSKTGVNYKVRAGFQYIKSIIAFAFSISETNINFGTLSPTTPVTRTNNLTISNGSANGYQITAFENHQLNVPSTGSIIPDTTCDDGTCTQSTSALWNNTLTYGFGYRCDNVTGTDCASGFTTANYYKQFADNSVSETPQAVVSGTNVGTNKQVQITYKVNISSSQPPGTYTNVITYIATPTF